MDHKKEFKNSELYWSNMFTEEQLSKLFHKLGENPDIQTQDSINKFLENNKRIPNYNIPAGYTYLGQFLAHEMTFNINSFTDVKSPSDVIVRTPLLDLDSVYGKGPLVEPIYYDHSRFDGRLYLSLKETKTCNGFPFIDFNRIVHHTTKGKPKKVSVPIIPDSRNDENILVAHIHLSIIRFHNKIVDKIVNSRRTELLNAQRTEEDTKVNNLWNMKFQADNTEKVPTLGEVLDAIIPKTGNTASSHGRQYTTTVTSKEQKQESIDFYSQIEALHSELAQIVPTQHPLSPFFIDEKNEDQEVNPLPTHSKLNTLLDKIFTLAKKETVWHFQWLILTDFLPRIVGNSMMNSIQEGFLKKKSSSYIPWKKVKYKYQILNNTDPLVQLPPIFTGAFFRFGHYMVLNRYTFQFADGSNSSQKDVLTIKKSFTPIKRNIKLSGFFSNDEKSEKASTFKGMVNTIMTNKISTTTQNHNNNIVVRNLKQTVRMRLPSAQCFAKNEIKGLKKDQILNSEHHKVKSDLEDKDSNLNLIAKSFPKNLKWKDGDFCFKNFLDHSPPWFYMGLEASILADGDHLGPVAGRVVAEVIIKLLESDPTSILGEGNLASRPIKVIEEEKKAGVPYSYTMADFLKFTNTYDFKKEEESEEPNKESQ